MWGLTFRSRRKVGAWDGEAVQAADTEAEPQTTTEEKMRRQGCVADEKGAIHIAIALNQYLNSQGHMRRASTRKHGKDIEKPGKRYRKKNGTEDSREIQRPTQDRMTAGIHDRKTSKTKQLLCKRITKGL